MATGALTEVTEEIASNLEEAAAVTRQIDTRSVGFFLGGIGVGIVVGFFFGYRYNREKIRAEAFAKSEEEVEKIREAFSQKIVTPKEKPSVAEVMEERGYSVKTAPERPTRPPVPVQEPIAVPLKPEDVWDYPAELAKRSPDAPYVIHQDERNEEEGYSGVVYTYWAGDDVLTDEDNRPLPHAQEIVGLNNLQFGHGTDSDDVVFVRNEQLKLEMEICRTPHSFEEEILGLERSD
jgi:hypothetical protein